MESSTPQPHYTDAQKQALILSMCGPLMSKVKMLFAHPKKNRTTAQNPNLLSVIDLVSEYLLPQYCAHHYNNDRKLSTMHSLCYLLSSKVQAVFTAGVIRTCIDQNWDLKGMKSVLLRILQEMDFQPEDYKKLQDHFDKIIQSQNLQSQSCIKAISAYLRNKKAIKIDEDDLKNPITTFQTNFEFVRAEIQKFRDQNMSHSCFTVLHPWAYDLDLVDFKYVISKDQTMKITDALKNSLDAQVFWLTYFKAQLSVSSDEFFSAIREICAIAGRLDYFDSQYQVYKSYMVKKHFEISLHEDAEAICHFIEDMTRNLADSVYILKFQTKLRTQQRERSELLDEGKIAKSYNLSGQPDFGVLNSKPLLKNLQMLNVSEAQQREPVDLIRQAFKVSPNQKQTQNLFLRFTNVDTEELKDLEIKFDGNLAQFKVGEGDCNHYVITNDKKLWESQFMIVNHQGQYYIRDLGIVHTSRVKVNPNTALQIHKGSLLDLGKVVHYHVDKLFHEKIPSQGSSPNFNTMKATQANYLTDDEAVLRARPTWISADENKDLVQNEILLEPSQKKNQFSIGRSNRRDVEIKLKAVSADHCRIEYNQEAGWFIHELDKERLSSNGTFVFMKNLQQMDDHEPSDLIPLYNGMTVSFINYELQIRIEHKTSEELANSVSEEYSDAQLTKNLSTEVPFAISQHTNAQSDKADTYNPYDEKLQATHKVTNKQNDDIIEEQKKDQYYDEAKDPSHVPSQADAQSSYSKQSQQKVANYDEVFNEDDKKSSKPQSPEKQPIGLYDDLEEPQSQRSQKSQAKQTPVKDEPKAEAKAQGINLFYDESPKAKSQMEKKNPHDDEDHQPMQRSYSQHHIGEILDGKTKPKEEVKLIHSDDEEEVKHEVKTLAKNAQQEEEVKSHRSQTAQSLKSTPAKEDDNNKQVQEGQSPSKNQDDVKSQQSQPVEKQVAQDEEIKSQISQQQHQESPEKHQDQQEPKADNPYDEEVKSVKSVKQANDVNEDHKSQTPVKQELDDDIKSHKSHVQPKETPTKEEQAQPAVYDQAEEEKQQPHQDDDVKSHKSTKQPEVKSPMKQQDAHQDQQPLPQSQDDEKHKIEEEKKHSPEVHQEPIVQDDKTHQPLIDDVKHPEPSPKKQEDQEPAAQQNQPQPDDEKVVEEKQDQIDQQ